MTLTGKQRREILAQLPAPEKGLSFTLRKVDLIVLPHAFHITSQHMKNSRVTILEADSAPCGYPGCQLSSSEHKSQLTLFIRVPQNRDLNAIEGLHDYLLSIKEKAAELNIEGFAFPDRDPEKIPASFRNESMGSFLSPPDYPDLSGSLRYGSSRNGGGDCALSSAYEDDDGYFSEQLPAHIVSELKRRFDEWEKSKPAIDSPRVIAWMQHLYAYMKNCYTDEQAQAEPFEYGKPATIIFPVPYYKLRTFRDDPRFSEEWRTSEQRTIKLSNDELRAKYAVVCTPDNHNAVRYIRKYYPEHQPRLDWITSTPRNPGDWYEKLEAPPRPEDCPGDARVRSKHPVNGSWCQFCGWYAEDEKKTA